MGLPLHKFYGLISKSPISGNMTRGGWKKTPHAYLCEGI